MFECKVCGRKFKNKTSLTSHKGYHKKKTSAPPPQELAKRDASAPGDKTKVEVVESAAPADRHQRVVACPVASTESKAGEIRALLEKGYTAEQLIEDFEFAESTVRLEVERGGLPERSPKEEEPPPKPPERPQMLVKTKVVTMEYTNIMVMAQEAAKNEWNWPDMNFTDFVDTVLYKFFKDRGIILEGYVVEDKKEGQRS